MKNSNYSTIIITNKHSNKTKIYTIKDKHVNNIALYKKLVFYFSLFALILFLSLFIFIKYERHEKEKLYNKVVMLENKLGNKLNNQKNNKNSIHQKLDNLNKAEEYLLKIEKYLNEREVKTLTSSKRNERNNRSEVGGEYYSVEEMNSDLIKSKQERVSEILNKIQSIPIGLPHIGRLTSTFGVRGNPFSHQGGEFHPGLDLAGTIGDPIKSTADGKVIFASIKGGYGNCVIIKHAYKYETLYGHLSEIDVKVGQNVKAGDVIGKLGSTGRSTGPHVHYEIIHNNEKKNPINYLYIP